MDTSATPALMVTSTNCRQAVGMSWKWLVRFAHNHHVPVLRIGRRSMIPATQLCAALQLAAATESPGASLAAEVARLEAEIAREVQALRRSE